MSWNIVGDLVTAGVKLFDELNLSDEEKMELTNKFKLASKNIELKERELENEYQKQITSRWTSDNSGNFLTKSVRPLSLIYLLGVITIMAFADGNIGNFTIDSGYIELFKILSITSFTAYFGGKTYERYKGKING